MSFVWMRVAQSARYGAFSSFAHTANILTEIRTPNDVDHTPSVVVRGATIQKYFCVILNDVRCA